MSDETKSGPSWKFWATLAFSIIGTLLTVLCGLYVKSVSQRFTYHSKMIRRLAQKQQETDRKITQLGVKLFGAKWLEAKSLDGVQPMLVKSVNHNNSETLKKARAMLKKMRSLYSDVRSLPTAPRSAAPRRHKRPRPRQ